MARAAPKRSGVDPVAPASPSRQGVLSRLSAGHLLMIVAGLVGMLLTVAFLRKADERTQVAVAARDLPAGSVLAKAAVRYEGVRMNDTLRDTVLERREVEKLAGWIATDSFAAGELISRRDLRPSAAPSGKRAMSIPINPARAVNGELAPGDRVDVLLAAEREVAIIVADAEVLAVNEPDRRGAFGGVEQQFTVTLAVNPRESQLLTAGIADGDIVITRTTGARSGRQTPPLPIDRGAAPSGSGS